MKKILISALIVLLLILFVFAVTKGIRFLHIKSIRNVKEASSNLNDKFNEANELSNKTYPSEVEGLEEAIKKLKISKQEFESKNVNNEDEGSLNTVEIKTYKIHYLWTILGNYRKSRGAQSLNLDLASTDKKDVYNLQFTVVGNYTSITDFIYDIENDEELNFEIKNFTMTSGTDTTNSIKSQSNNNQNNNNNNNQNDNTQNTSTQNSTSNTKSSSKTTKSNGIDIQAKFTVEEVGITLD